MNTKARVIAFYLPQFHPIPENDEWWGKGFTEWTNVAKAKPLFRGHYQPKIPADLGFYDLRLSEVREAQAEMARNAGIEGFCYWHYWFGNGKRLLERPFNEVLESGKPNFPFCLGWANESWSGIWHGAPNKILIEQKYLGLNDYINHFNAILPALKDKRYIKVNGKPLFYIYSPNKLPDFEVLKDCWNKLCINNGLKGIHFVGQVASYNNAKKLLEKGYDAVQTNWQKKVLLEKNKHKYIWNKISDIFLSSKFKNIKYDYAYYAERLFIDEDKNSNFYPTILTGWDNSPRSGKKGRIFINYTPKTFKKHLESCLKIIKGKTNENNIVFLKSWNEWAEGNYLEPDLKYKYDFLETFKQTMKL